MRLKVGARFPLELDAGGDGERETGGYEHEAVLLFVIGLLAVAGVAGLLAIASGPHTRTISISDQQGGRRPRRLPPSPPTVEAPGFFETRNK